MVIKETHRGVDYTIVTPVEDCQAAGDYDGRIFWGAPLVARSAWLDVRENDLNAIAVATIDFHFEMAAAS